ncbi:MAG: hypothetical protein V4730_12070 [Pseudomonadota bacterium]
MTEEEEADALVERWREKARATIIARAGRRLAKLDRPPRLPKPETIVSFCPRYKVSKLIKLLPTKYFEYLEHNQQIAHCCRHPENHDIEAFKSHPNEKAPDIYVFYCTCGRKHRIFCVGGGDIRPVWEVR